MTGVMTLYRSSIGKKAVMAVTGLIWIGFVVMHMYGNTKVYYGPKVFNDYAAGLRELGHPVFGHEHLLWVMRIVVLVAIVLHIWSAQSLIVQSRESTMTKGIMPRQPYARKRTLQATFASQTMRWGGLAIFLFILFHLANLTFGWVGYAPDQFKHPEVVGTETVYNVYDNFVHTFQNPVVSIIYIVAMVALGLHLYHGTWSVFQTLGLNSQRLNGLWRGLAIAVALLVAVVNISFPIAVLTGIVQ